MSQGTLAKLIGVKQPSLSALESGTSKRPNSANLMRIAAILDANPDWIVTGQGDPWEIKAPSASGAADLLAMYNSLDDTRRGMIIAVANSLMSDSKK